MTVAVNHLPGTARTDIDEERWAAVQRRDGRADDRFFYSVSTTGVYCRPSCPARRPRREHVRFHETRAEAELAGYRACRRCQPDGPKLEERRAHAAVLACRLIESADEMPAVPALAAAVGMSSAHFHRVFRAATGVTPRAYAAAHRHRRVRAALSDTGSITRAIYDAGFNSSGRFYATSPSVLGMAPATYRAGAPGITIRFAVRDCSLGVVLVAATDRGICAILMGDDADGVVRDLQRRFPRARLVAGDATFDGLVDQVIGLVEAPGSNARLPLDIRGTAFQQRVWQALRDIPPGATMDYAEVARRIGAPHAARAVAGACAANPLAVAIPCHRVVRRDGSVSGYRWGVARKRALLAREAGS